MFIICTKPVWKKSCSRDVGQNTLSQSNFIISKFLCSKLSKSGLWTLKFTVSQELTDFCMLVQIHRS